MQIENLNEQFVANKFFRVVGIFILPTAGVLWYALLNMLLWYCGFQYQTQSYLIVLFWEWIWDARITFLCIFPTFFLTLKLIVPRISWKALIVVSILFSVLLTIPPFIRNMQRWQILVSSIKDLPLNQVEYSRWDNGFADGPPGMSINFTITDENYTYIKREIIERLPEINSRLVRYPLSGYTDPLKAHFKATKVTSDGREISDSIRDEFIKSKSVIKGTILSM